MVCSINVSIMRWILLCSVYVVDILACIRLVNCSDENESSDSIQTKSVEEFKRLCPFTDLCYSKSLRNVTTMYNTQVPCCSECYCGVTSDTDSCPDKPGRFLNEAEILQMNQAPEQCIYAQLRQFSLTKLNGKQYKIVGNCPANYKYPDIKIKCSREYHEFDFEKDDVTTLMPVFSEFSNISYRNYYCALCHGSPQEKLHFWKTEIKCINQRKLLLSNLNEITERLSEEPLCQVVFVPSQTMLAETCNGKIDRCNVTGTWEKYDMALESACLSYTSDYDIFKNVHCYLCNGHSITDIQYMCDTDSSQVGKESFVALLDFNDLEGPSNEIEKTCSRGSKYDPYKDKCRTLSCASGMLLSKERCVPLYSSLIDSDDDKIVFGLQINLFPNITRILGWRHLDLLVSSVLNEISTKMVMIYTSYDVSFCAFTPYIKLTHSIEDTLYHMGLNNYTDFMPFVSYLTVIVEFSVRGITNISETLEEMAVIFTVNDHFAQYSIQYPSDNHQISVEENYVYNVSDERVNTLEALPIDIYEYLMLATGLNDPDDGLGIVWFLDDEYRPVLPSRTCDVAISVQPHPFCPRIELTRKEFNIDIDARRVTSLESEEKPLNLVFSKVLTTKQNNSVLVCSDEYFAKLPSTKKDSNVNYALVILTIICLVPSIASLLLSFVAYCVLTKLRNVPGLNNMGLVFHLLLAQILAVVNIFTDIKVSWLCTAVGIALHFSLLSSFFWMFVCTFHMMLVFIQIKNRSANVEKRKRFVLYLIFSELTAALLVGANIAKEYHSNGKPNHLGYGGSSCYIRDSSMILYLVGLPLGVVLVANFTMFSFVVWRVARLPDMSKNSNRERKNILIFAKLSTLTGLTWIFGFFYQSFEIPVFAYIYIVFSAGQGVFIMLSFVVNKRVFDMLHVHWCRRSRHKSESMSHHNSAASFSGSEGNTRSVSFDTKF